MHLTRPQARYRRRLLGVCYVLLTSAEIARGNVRCSRPHRGVPGRFRGPTSVREGVNLKCRPVSQGSAEEMPSSRAGQINHSASSTRHQFDLTPCLAPRNRPAKYLDNRVKKVKRTLFPGLCPCLLYTSPSPRDRQKS